MDKNYDANDWFTLKSGFQIVTKDFSRQNELKNSKKSKMLHKSDQNQLQSSGCCKKIDADCSLK